MREILFRALRFFILGAAAGGVGAFTVLHADDATPPSTTTSSSSPAAAADTPAAGAGAAADAKSGDAAKADAPGQAAPGPKVFTPTQEISPDQEIDFPADL